MNTQGRCVYVYIVPFVLVKGSFEAREMNSVEDRDDRAKRMKCSYKES